MTISYLEKEGQDQLCGLTYIATLRHLEEQGVITKERADDLAKKWTAITINPGSFIGWVKNLLGFNEEHTIIVKFIKI